MYRRHACNFKEAVAEALCSQSADVSAQTRGQLYQERKCMCVRRKERRIISSCCRAEVVTALEFLRLRASVCPLYRTPGGDLLDLSLISNTLPFPHHHAKTDSLLFDTADHHSPPCPSFSFVSVIPYHHFPFVHLHQLRSLSSPFSSPHQHHFQKPICCCPIV